MECIGQPESFPAVCKEQMWDFQSGNRKHMAPGDLLTLPGAYGAFRRNVRGGEAHFSNAPDTLCHVGNFGKRSPRTEPNEGANVAGPKSA